MTPEELTDRMHYKHILLPLALNAKDLGEYSFRRVDWKRLEEPREEECEIGLPSG
jgi:hypothetical protein